MTDSARSTVVSEDEGRAVANTMHRMLAARYAADDRRVIVGFLVEQVEAQSPPPAIPDTGPQALVLDDRLPRLLKLLRRNDT